MKLMRFFKFKIENIFEITEEILEINVTKYEYFCQIVHFYVCNVKLTENEPSCMLHMA